MKLPLILALALAGTPAKDAPKEAGKAAAEAAKKDPGPPPQQIAVRHEDGKVAWKISVTPGVGAAGKPMAVQLEIAEMLKKPDAQYGSRKPITDVVVTAVMVAAPEAKKKSKAEPFADARLSVRLRDVGTYGFSFTPPANGMYALHFTGQSESVGEFTHGIQVPVGVWPVPEGATLAALPSKLPEATLGNRVNGRAICDLMCIRNAKFALPTNEPPTFLHSGTAAAMDDNALLQAVVGDRASRLSAVDRADLLLYLHGLHLRVRDFFPEATSFMAKSFTINDYGKERLAASAQLKLDDKTASGVVFVVFKTGEPGPDAKLVAYDDRVARDKLKKNDKLGYIIFFETEDPKMRELGVALNKEPNYSVLGVRARDASGKQDPGTAKQLASLAGEGKFNDAKSFAKVAADLRKKFLPMYLRAAELATMYVLDEREFTAFDEELN